MSEPKNTMSSAEFLPALNVTPMAEKKIDATKKKKVLVTVKIEKTGGSMKNNPACSVAFYVGDEFGKELLKRKFNIIVQWPTYDCISKIKYGSFEPRCWKEFWSNDGITIKPELYLPCVTNPEAKSGHQVWVSISKFIDELEKIFPDDTHEIIFVSDNASYDIATIDYQLDVQAGRKAMRYSTSGKYRSTIPPDDMLMMLSPVDRAFTMETVDKNSTYDHDAMEKAKYVYWQAVMCYGYMREINP